MSNDSAEYKVGYRKPPKSGQYKPGQSGNVSGRPKRAITLQTICRELYNAKITIREGGRSLRVTRIEAVYLKQFERAMKGDPQALRDIIANARSVGMSRHPVIAGLNLEALDDRELDKLEILVKKTMGK